MANDIAADIDGDLTIEGGSLRIATLRNRDRNLIMSRLMTMRGEVPEQSFLGFPPNLIGRQNDAGTQAEAEAAARQSLLVDIALVPTRPTIRVLLLSLNKLAVLVQSNRTYPDSQSGEKLVVAGDFWTMSDMPMTQPDGSEA